VTVALAQLTQITLPGPATAPRLCSDHHESRGGFQRKLRFHRIGRLLSASRIRTFGRSKPNGIASDPNEWLGHFSLGIGYEGLGKPAKQFPNIRRLFRCPTAIRIHRCSGACLCCDRQKNRSRKDPSYLERAPKDTYVSPYLIATIYAGLGEKDKSFAFLEKAEREKNGDLVWAVRADPRLDNLRSDPRFQALLRRMNFPQ